MINPHGKHGFNPHLGTHGKAQHSKPENNVSEENLLRYFPLLEYEP